MQILRYFYSITNDPPLGHLGVLGQQVPLLAQSPAKPPSITHSPRFLLFTQDNGTEIPVDFRGFVEKNYQKRRKEIAPQSTCFRIAHMKQKCMENSIFQGRRPCKVAAHLHTAFSSLGHGEDMQGGVSVGGQPGKAGRSMLIASTPFHRLEICSRMTT